MKTWQIEMLVVACILALITALKFIFTDAGPIELVGSIAVLASFGHMQIADRLREKAAQQPHPDVECHRWLSRYLLAKEILWVVFFFATGSYAALAGCFIFLFYQVWRSRHARNRVRKESRDPGVMGKVNQFLEENEDYKMSFALEYSSIIGWSAEFTPRRRHKMAMEHSMWSQSGDTPEEAIVRAMEHTKMQIRREIQ